MKQLLMILTFLYFTIVSVNAQSLSARIRNPRVGEGNFIWDIDIMRTDNFGSNNILDNCDFYFYINQDGFTSADPILFNIHASLTGNNNYSFDTGRAGAGNNQCYVNLTHNSTGGGTNWEPLLDTWEQLCTVSLPIADSEEQSALIWHTTSTGFSYYDDQPLTKTLSGNGDISLQDQPSIVTLTYNFTQEGWYMVSIPVIPADSSVSVLFPSALGGFAFKWDALSSTYNIVNKIEPQNGYWIAIAGTASNLVCGQSIDSYTLHFTNHGWYMIGSVIGSTDFTNPSDNPDGMVANPAFYWDQVYGNYISVDTLNEKRGHWVAVFGECDLIIERTGSTGYVLISKTGSSKLIDQYSISPPLPPNVDWNIKELIQHPCEYKLSQNFPNPFNPQTIIEYTLPEDVFTELEIYNELGQKVKTLVEEWQSGGHYKVRWNGKDNFMRKVPSGIYFLRMEAGNFSEIRKMTVLR